MRTSFFLILPVASLVLVAVLAPACGSANLTLDLEPETTAVEAGSDGAAAGDHDDSILTETSSGAISVGRIDARPFVEVGIETDLDLGDGPALSIMGRFGDDEFLVVPTDDTGEAPADHFYLLDAAGGVLRGEAEIEDRNGDIVVDGGYEVDRVTTFVSATLRFGAGTSTFELDGNRATIIGDLGSNTFAQMQHLIAEHPEVDTLVLQDIAGSVNDEVNVQTGRLVREAGYRTVVPADGEIASGGVDLFAAGTERIVEPGGRLGVHSWCCSPSGTPVAELDRDDPAHGEQLAYFNEVLGSELGPEFYFFTLTSAAFDDIHWMSDEELATYLVTNA